MKVVLKSGATLEIDNPEQIAQVLKSLVKSTASPVVEENVEGNGYKCRTCQTPLTGSRRKLCGKRACSLTRGKLVARRYRKQNTSETPEWKHIKSCLECTNSYMPKKGRQRFCSDDCRASFWAKKHKKIKVKVEQSPSDF